MKKAKTIKADKPIQADKPISKEASVRKTNLSKLWKIVAIVVIIAFVLLIIGSAMRAYRFHKSFVKPTQEQIDSAEQIASAKLQEMGEIASNYQIFTSNRMPNIDREGKRESILQVTFYNKTTTHTFLVDVNSGEILEHSQTDFYVPRQDRGGPSAGMPLVGRIIGPPR